MSTQPGELPLSMRDLCFIDIETTGSLFGYHEIIELAVVRTSPSGDDVLATWHRRIRPFHPERLSVPAAYNSYEKEAWRYAEESSEALWTAFTEFVWGGVPICHNPSFDRAFISLAAAGVGIRELGLDYHWIGTESLGWPLYRQGLLPKLSLSSLCEYLRVDAEPHPHNALDGAHACRRVYRALFALFADSGRDEWAYSGSDSGRAVRPTS